MKLASFPLSLCLLSAATSGSLLAQEPPPPAPTPPPATKDQVVAWLKESLPFTVHGSVLMWHYQPLDLPGVDANTEIYYANLLFDTTFDSQFGYHFEPRFRDSKLRPYFESNVWIQENYLSWRPYREEGGVLKVGKVYSQFGRFWDGVFYGNIPYFDGVKLDPDMGLSWEQSVKAGDSVVIDYSAQFFPQDGSTNGSLDGRDTLSIGTQRNIAVARVAPTFKLGERTSATVGASGMYFEADLGAAGDNNVSRANAEAALSFGSLTAFADFTHQEGSHVVDDATLGVFASNNTDYLMSGVSYKWDDFTFRYSYSFGDYEDDDVKEDLHLPGVEFQVNEHLSIWLEYVYWNRDNNGADTIVDRSLNLILYGAF